MLKQTVEGIRQGKRSRLEQEKKRTPSQEYISFICHLYGDVYDDRVEDSKIKGMSWEPEAKASHKSMTAFLKELDEIHGIHYPELNCRRS